MKAEKKATDEKAAAVLRGFQTAPRELTFFPAA